MATNSRLNSFLFWEYSSATKPDAPRYRLYGEHWALGIVSNSPAQPVGKSQSILQVDGLYRKELSSFRGENVISADLFRTTNLLNNYRLVKDDDYPLDPPVELLVQPIAKRLHNRDWAYQMLQGKLFLPGDAGLRRRGFIERLQEKLSLGAAQGEQDLGIAFYPDGFAFHASAGLPWASEEDRFDGWFKLTNLRNTGELADGRQKRGTSALVLCTDPSLPGNPEMLRIWQDQAQNLAAILAGKAGAGPQWLQLEVSGTFDPADFAWECQDMGEFRVKRDAGGPIRVGTQSIRIRLSPGATREQQVSASELRFERLAIDRGDSGIVVSAGEPASIEAAAERDAPLVVYRFDVADASEWIGLGTEPEVPARNRLELAVPLVETASLIRARSGMPARAEAKEEDTFTDPVGGLWTFTPIDTGLLHWPFPDATMNGLNKLIAMAASDGSAEAAPDEVLSKPGQTKASGAMLFGNGWGMPGSRVQDRDWRLSIAGADTGTLAISYGNNGDGWTLDSAHVDLAGCDISFDGAFPIVPFAQRPDRLLPERADCTLNRHYLRALSPHLLRGLEARMWALAERRHAGEQIRAVQAKLIVRDLRMEAPAPDKDQSALHGRVQLDCHIGSSEKFEDSREEEEQKHKQDDTLRPWIWSRHGALPMVQTQPLALSGEAQSAPSSTRELFPLERRSSKLRSLYSLENGMEMDAVFPRLVVTRAGDEAFADYASATALDSASRPTGIAAETGMAMLSMASITIFPGEDGTAADPMRLFDPGLDSAQAWAWPTGSGEPLTGGESNPVPFAIEVRHDMALRDEFYAATGSVEDEGERSVAILQGEFVPLPGNGPRAPRGLTSYRDCWIRKERLAALAATDRRHFVEANTGEDSDIKPWAMTNYYGKKRLPAQALEFAHQVSLDATAGVIPALGLFYCGPSRPPADPPMSRADRNTYDRRHVENLGLPASSDWLGLTKRLFDGGEFSFGTWEFRFGGVQHEFKDQAAVLSFPAEMDGQLSTRQIDNNDAISTPKVLQIGKLRLWLKDLVVFNKQEDAETWRERSPTEWGNTAMAHLYSHRWAIGWDAAEDDGDLPADIPFPINGKDSALVFRPQLVRGCYKENAVEGDGADAAAFEAEASIEGRSLTIEIGGQLGFKKPDGTFIPCVETGSSDDQARLYVTRSVAEEGGELTESWDWTLAPGARTLLRLEEEAAHARRATVLELSGSDTGFAAEATLHVDLFGEVSRIPVRQTAGNLVYSFIHDDPSTGLYLQKANVDLAPAAALLEMAWKLDVTSTNQDGIALTLSCLLAPGAEGGDVAVGEAEIRLEQGDIAIKQDVIAEAKHFDAGGLALTFKGTSPLSPSQASWVDRFAVSETRGSFIAALADREAVDGGVAADFTVMDYRAQWQVGPDHGLALSCSASGDDTLAVELDGQIDLESSVDDLGASYAGALYFAGSPVGGLGSASAIAGQVLHRLAAADDAQTGFTFATVEPVLFGPGGAVGLQVGAIFERAVGGESILLVLDVPAGSTASSRCYALAGVPAKTRLAASERLAARQAEGEQGLRGWAARLLRSYDHIGLEDGEALEHASCSLEELISLATDPAAMPVLFLAPHVVDRIIEHRKFDFRSSIDRISSNVSRFALLAPQRPWIEQSSQKYRLLVTGYRHERIISAVDAGSLPSFDGSGEDKIEQWYLRILGQHASWAGFGVFVAQDGHTMAVPRLVRSGNIRRSQAPTLPWVDAPTFIDPSLIALPGPEQYAGSGYDRARSMAIALEALGPHRGAVDSAHGPEVRLSVHALERAWVKRGPRSSDRVSYWLSLRGRTNFRAPIDWSEGSTRLTWNMTHESARAAAAWLDPSASTPVKAPAATKNALSQAFAPHRVFVREIAGRPGAYETQELGLANVDAHGRASPESSVPATARAPRPPLLAINDRLVANEFDSRPLAIAEAPRVYLYDERAAAPFSGELPQAYTRDPRSRGYWIGALERPGNGLIDKGWDGSMTLRISPSENAVEWTDDAEPRPRRWTLATQVANPAVAAIEGRQFALSVSESAQGTDAVLTIAEDAAVAGDEAEPGLREAAASVIAPTPVFVRLTLDLREGDALVIRRTVEFSVIAMPSAARPLLRPAWLNFEDPALNDMLAGPSIIQYSSDKSRLLACDREKFRIDERPTIALRNVPNINGDGLQDQELAFEATAIILVTEDSGQQREEEVHLQPLHTVIMRGHHVLQIDAALLVPRNGEDPDPVALSPGDKLVISVGEGDNAVGLTLEISAEYFAPINPAAYALLELAWNQNGGSISAPLYAQSNRPGMLHLLDPRDLLSGVARFIASYSWLHFAHGGGPGKRPSFYIQKIAGDGASYIEPDIAKWQTLSVPQCEDGANDGAPGTDAGPLPEPMPAVPVETM